VDARDDDGQTPLSRAVERGRGAVVRLPLATGKVDVDARDDDGRTPQSRAVERGHEAVVRLLFATGKADVDSRDSNGRTPLSIADGGGHETVVKFLEEAKIKRLSAGTVSYLLQRSDPTLVGWTSS
jgi:ankyrin repeat protein